MKKKATQKKAPVKNAIAKVPKTPTKTAETVMGFRAGTQAARMYQLLSDGKARSVAEIHKVIKDTTEDHVGNGLLYVLRKRGYETGEFHIIMTVDHKLQLVKGPKPEKTARTPKASLKTSRTAAAEKALRQPIVKSVRLVAEKGPVARQTAGKAVGDE